MYWEKKENQVVLQTAFYKTCLVFSEQKCHPDEYDEYQYHDYAKNKHCTYIYNTKLKKLLYNETFFAYHEWWFRHSHGSRIQIPSCFIYGNQPILEPFYFLIITEENDKNQENINEKPKIKTTCTKYKFKMPDQIKCCIKLLEKTVNLPVHDLYELIASYIF